MRVLALCDGGGSIGVGHVMRSLALAEAAVAAGHDVVVAGHFEGAFLAGQLAGAPVEVVPLATSVAASDPRDVVELVSRLRPDVLHLDSYDTSDRLLDLLAVVGVEEVTGAVVMPAPLLSNMEDGTFGRRAADVVVDPTLGAELSDRPDDGSSWLLRGARYIPVRQRVIDARHRHDPESLGTAVGVRETDVAHRVLVVMGGTDPMGLAPVAVDLLARTGLALDVTVIAAGENAERARAAAGSSLLSLNVLAPVDDLPTLMTSQDLVISAAGTSVWELCCLGVPLAVIWAVDNQREGYDRVVAAGAAVGLGGPDLGGPDLGGPDLGGRELGRSGPAGEQGSGPERVAAETALDLLRRVLTDSRLRADLALAGREVVDGLGAWRVVRTWEIARRHRQRIDRSSDRLTARPATLQDARLLWQWRNDPATRAGSRSSDQVPWDDHLRWVTATLSRKDRRLLIVEGPVGKAGSVEAVGTVRWDLAGGSEESGEWEVSITVAPERRGQSLARSVLSAAEVALSQATPSRVAGSEVARSEVAHSEVAHSEVAHSEVARPEVTRPEVTRTSGSAVTAYLAVVHVDNRASLALFEACDYLPDLPPDARGFMRFRKAARVP